LKRFLENQAELRHKEDLKEIRSLKRTGHRALRLGLLKKVKKEKINASYIFRKALNYYWLENEQEILEYEKQNGDRRY